jgi:hypothetical protein
MTPGKLYISHSTIIPLHIGGIISDEIVRFLKFPYLRKLGDIIEFENHYVTSNFYPLVGTELIPINTPFLAVRYDECSSFLTQCLYNGNMGWIVPLEVYEIKELPTDEYHF